MYQYILIQFRYCITSLLMYTIEYKDNIYSDIVGCIAEVCHPDQFTLMKIFGIVVYDA